MEQKIDVNDQELGVIDHALGDILQIVARVHRVDWKNFMYGWVQGSPKQVDTGLTPPTNIHAYRSNFRRDNLVPWEVHPEVD